MAAPDTSLRPKARPESQTERMLKPKTITQVKKDLQQKQLVADFGDVEFRADLEPQFSWNPLARLGYDPKKAKVLPSNLLEPNNAYAIPDSSTAERITNASEFKRSDPLEVERINPGDVVTKGPTAVSPVWSHEFTHKGIERLKEYLDEDPEFFKGKYGEKTFNLINKISKGGKEAKDGNERVTEFFDYLEDTINVPGYTVSKKQIDKSLEIPDIKPETQRLLREKDFNKDGQISAMEFGQDTFFANSNQSTNRKDFQNYLKFPDNKSYKRYIKSLYPGLVGAVQAAQDLLEAQGEVPKVKKKTLSFWEKVAKHFGYSRLGFNEGGDVIGPKSELERQREVNIAEQMATLPKKKDEYKPSVDPQKEEIIKKYNLDGARSGWQVGPTAFHTIYKNLPTNFRLLTEFILGKDTPITMADFTKDELVSMIALSENQEKNKLNLKNRKLKNQPENVTTVTTYKLKPTDRYPDWVESNPYFRAMAHSLFSPEYQVRTTLGKYDTEDTPSSLIVKDAYDMNIGQRSLPKLGNRKDLTEVLDYMRIDPEMAGEFIANVFRPNPQDSRKIDLVIPKRKKVENFNEGGDVSAQMQSMMIPSADEDTRSTEEYLQHPLETVPFFQRPIGSSTKDLKIGEDDAGNPVFQTSMGNEYTVKLNPDQRTLRKKVSDAIPAVKEAVTDYIEDPKLPTKEQLSEFAKQAGQSAVESVEDLGDLMFKGEGTTGDVFGAALSVGAASVPFDVPKGALRIFGGVNAEGTAKDKNLKKAIKLLKKSGVDPTSGPSNARPVYKELDIYEVNKDIWEKTGWYVDPTDGQWRFEIDDSKSNLKDFKSVFKTNKNPDDPADDPNLSSSFFEELGKVARSREDGVYNKLGNVLEHEEFFKRYPDLKDVDVIFYSDPSQRNLLGSASEDEIFVNVSAYRDYENIKSTLLHEIQHIIQAEEDFVPGASSKYIPNFLTENKSREIKTKIDPLKVQERKLQAELDLLIPHRKNTREKYANNPLKNLSESDQIAIYKLKPINRETGIHEGPSWASIARDYDVTVQEVKTAYGREQLLEKIDKDIIKYNANLNKIINDLYELELEDFRIDTNFYRGAGGEIEARLVQYRKNLPPEERGKSFPIDDRLTMLQGEGGKFEYTGKHGVDPHQYTPKPRNEPEKEKSFLSKVGKKLGLSESRENLKDYGYRTDNPATKGYDDGEEWLKNKQKTAEDRAKKSSGENATSKLLSGAITGYMGQDFKRPLFLNTEMLSKLKGANNEKRYVGEGRYDLLRKRVDEKGFDPEQKYDSKDDYGNAIIVGVNHKGEAFIVEGNTRVAVAKDLNVPSIRAEVKYYNGAEEVDGPYSPQNIIQYIEKPKDFNKGGTVMNKQMEMAFMQQGGLQDDGMNQDPVSGNEVPSGSMASEVRDDISAQLSEGEYVVPADVVRYFGVKHFEDLRNKAKGGLNKMEADGRIGGEPVPVGGPKAGLRPDEMQEIQNMFEGGMVAGAAEGADFSFYNPTGSTVEEAVTTPGPAGRPMYSGEFSFEQPGAGLATPPPVSGTPAPEQQAVTLYGPNGEIINLMLPKDQVMYDQLIAQGYGVTAPQTVKSESGSKKDDDEVQADPNAWMDKYDYTNSGVLMQQSLNALDPKEGIEGMVGKVFGGGVFGQLSSASNAAQIAANIRLLNSQGVDTKELQEKLDTYIKTNNIGWMPKSWIDGDQLEGDVKDQIGGDLFKHGDKAYTAPETKTIMQEAAKDTVKERTKTKEVVDPDTGETKTVITSGTVYKPEGIDVALVPPPNKEKKKSEPSFHDQYTAAVKKSREKSEASRQAMQRAQDKGGSSKNVADLKKKYEDEGGTWASGGRARGGLMKKKKGKK